MKNKEVPDVLSDVSKDFIEYFKSISAKEPDDTDVSNIDRSENNRSEIDRSKVDNWSNIDRLKVDRLKVDRSEIDQQPKIDRLKVDQGSEIDRSKIDQVIVDKHLSNALKIIQDTKNFIYSSEELIISEKVVLIYLLETSLSNDYILEFSNNELQKIFSMSRNTVRSTIRQLDKKEYIKHIKGINQNSPWKIDMRNLYRKVIANMDDPVQLTDFLDFWYTKICPVKNCPSHYVLLCLYVLKNQTNIQNKILEEGGSKIDRLNIDRSDIDQSEIDRSKIDRALRASTGDSINNILWYSIARGFNSEKITAAFINYLVDSLEGVGGSYQERTDILHNFEMEYAVAIEYTKKRNAKNPWSYIITCVKNGYTSSDDTIELRKEVAANITAINKYLGNPDDVELIGLDELTALSKLFDLNITIDAKNAANCRSKIKRKISELKEGSEQVLHQFKLKFGSRSDELLKRF
jgi:DNA-binding Lrp family transcriptional regulator